MAAILGNMILKEHFPEERSAILGIWDNDCPLQRVVMSSYCAFVRFSSLWKRRGLPAEAGSRDGSIFAAYKPICTLILAECWHLSVLILGKYI